MSVSQIISSKQKITDNYASRNTQSITSELSSNLYQKSKVVSNNENFLMSYKKLPLISYEDCKTDYNVNQKPTISVLTLESTDKSSDVINKDRNAMLRHKSIKFVFDTAATRHIVCDKRLLTNFQNCSTIVKWGNAKSIQVSGMGDMFLRFKNNDMLFKLENCMYMPQLGINIISHPQIRGNYTSVFNKDSCQILCKGKVIAHGRRENNLFCLDVDRVVIPDQALMVSDSISSEQRCSRNERNKVTTVGDNVIDVGVLHNRMGHVGHANLVRLLQNTSGFTKLSNKNNVQLQHCEDCLKGKFTNNVNKSSSGREFDHLEKVSSDICGPVTPGTYDKYNYFITFLDVKSRYLEVKLLRSKDEAYDAFAQFANMYENNTNNKRIRILATDN
ncbi:Retrovirus-related pol polyprotein from transposon tnt 1-94, partial [Thalictrum thalictroides]